MEHTKGKLPKKLVINQRQTDIGFLDNMGLFEPIVTLELSTEVVCRYNCHALTLEALHNIIVSKDLDEAKNYAKKAMSQMQKD